MAERDRPTLREKPGPVGRRRGGVVLVGENVLRKPSREKGKIALNMSKKVRGHIMRLWQAAFCSRWINEHPLLNQVLPSPPPPLCLHFSRSVGVAGSSAAGSQDSCASLHLLPPPWSRPPHVFCLPFLDCSAAVVFKCAMCHLPFLL